MKHIYLDKSFFFFLIIIIVTGSFNNFICYFCLLVIHELGHTIIGLLQGYKLDKISFYPTGGVTVFNLPLNIPLKKELIILLAGPIFQILGFYLLKYFLDNSNLYIYHYSLLIFNLLPIYPLDGGKILNTVCNYHFNYLKSFYITFIISLIGITILIICNIYYFNLNLLSMIIVILIKLLKCFKERNYSYNKFLLERYMYEYHYSKNEYINSIRKFYRDRSHIINLVREKDVLKKHFVQKSNY